MKKFIVDRGAGINDFVFRADKYVVTDAGHLEFVRDGQKTAIVASGQWKTVRGEEEASE